MRGAWVILIALSPLATSVVASPRLDPEESAVMDREVMAARDPDLWQGREVYPLSEREDDRPLTDGRKTIEETWCYPVRVRTRREDGGTTITRLDWCD
jgi:hypothetical protein